MLLHPDNNVARRVGALEAAATQLHAALLRPAPHALAATVKGILDWTEAVARSYEELLRHYLCVVLIARKNSAAGRALTTSLPSNRQVLTTTP